MAENDEGHVNTISMDKESLYRRRSQEAKNRIESMARRQDLQGRGFYKRYNKSPVP